LTLTFNVRQATLDDLDTMVEFNAAMALETEDKGLNLEALREGVGSLLEDDSLGFYLLAESGGTVVGQLMVTTEWSDWRNANFWWLQSLYVLPEYRRQGVFRLLYERVCELANDAGNVCGLRLYVERSNHRAQQAYVNLGMVLSHYDMYEVEFQGEEDN